MWDHFLEGQQVVREQAKKDIIESPTSAKAIKVISIIIINKIKNSAYKPGHYLA